MSQLKYDLYAYDSEADMLTAIEQSGYEISLPIEQAGQLIGIDGNDDLDYSYFANPVSNLPDEDPEYYSGVFINSARIGNSKLPSSDKAKQKDVKYFNKYINRFAGQPVIES